jgi:hypothetical protein
MHPWVYFLHSVARLVSDWGVLPQRACDLDNPATRAVGSSHQNVTSSGSNVLPFMINRAGGTGDR